MEDKKKIYESIFICVLLENVSSQKSTKISCSLIAKCNIYLTNMTEIEQFHLVRNDMISLWKYNK